MVNDPFRDLSSQKPRQSDKIWQRKWKIQIKEKYFSTVISLYISIELSFKSYLNIILDIWAHYSFIIGIWINMYHDKTVQMIQPWHKPCCALETCVIRQSCCEIYDCKIKIPHILLYNLNAIMICVEFSVRKNIPVCQNRLLEIPLQLILKLTWKLIFF